MQVLDIKLSSITPFKSNKTSSTNHRKNGIKSIFFNPCILLILFLTDRLCSIKTQKHNVNKSFNFHAFSLELWLEVRYSCMYVLLFLLIRNGIEDLFYIWTAMIRQNIARHILVNCLNDYTEKKRSISLDNCCIFYFLPPKHWKKPSLERERCSNSIE